LKIQLLHNLISVKRVLFENEEKRCVCTYTHTRLCTHRVAVLQTRYVDPGTGKFSSAGTCKKYRCTFYSGTASDRKILKKHDLPSTRSGIHHACVRCSTGLDVHACSYELASCLKGAAGSQLCQRGAARPDRLAPLLATNRLAPATVIMFAVQNRTCTRSRSSHTRVTEPFLVPLSDSLPVSKHPIILYVC
jgi:hypothetical protein